MADETPKQPYKPEVPSDFGPATAAQSRLKVVERASDDPEDPTRRTRKIPTYELYFRRHLITKRQHAAAEALLYAWERTKCGPPSIAVVTVDNSPKPDAQIVASISQARGFAWVMGFCPRPYRKLVEFVVLENNPIATFPFYSRAHTLDQLRHALEAVSKGINGPKKRRG